MREKVDVLRKWAAAAIVSDDCCDWDEGRLYMTYVETGALGCCQTKRPQGPCYHMPHIPRKRRGSSARHINIDSISGNLRHSAMYNTMHSGLELEGNCQALTSVYIQCCELKTSFLPLCFSTD